MKTKAAFILLPVIVTAIWFIARGNDIGDTGPHGGRIKRVDRFIIEMKSVPTDNVIYAYLLDKSMLAVQNRNVQCNARLYYADSTVFDLRMVPYGIDGFVGETAAGNYNTCVITFRTEGQSVSATFENNRLLAGK